MARHQWFAGVLVAVLAGCQTTTPGTPAPGASAAASPAGSPGPIASSSGVLPEAFQHVYEVPADPIAVTPTLDEATAVEADIPIEGGALTATAADGTRFDLTIPGDALVEAAHIRMTPVSKIDGMPFGTDPHAVQLEPSGLHFVRYVTLTITPKTAIPVDQQILFGYDATGENLTLALPADNSANIAIKLLHFSGAGVTAGTAAQVSAASPRLGASAEARITSAIAAELGRARQAALLGEDVSEATMEAVLEFLEQYNAEVVQPRVAAAGTSCAAGVLAMQTFLGYQRQVALLGGGGQDDPSAQVDLAKVLAEVCVREEYQRCHDNHVVQNMIPTWLGAKRQMALLGVPDGDPIHDQLDRHIEKCLIFDMTFESQATLDNNGGGWESFVRANFEIRFNAIEMRFMQVDAELVNYNFKFKAQAKGCTITSTPGNGTFKSIHFMFLRSTRTPTDEVGFVRDIEYAYVPGATKESVLIRCPKAPDTRIPNAGFWSGTFINLHRGESGTKDYGMGAPSFAFEAVDWDVFGNGQAYFAKKEWIKADSDFGETGTLKLYHTPE